ncbi:hypothetical protein ACFQX7_03915 [Luedemannella flava]
MSTVVDAPRQAGTVGLSRWWWLVPEAVLLLAALAAAPLSPSAQSPAQLSADLVARSVTAIEQLSPAEHHNHGHAVDAAQTKVACVVELMGFAPADAKRAADVTTAYTYFLCAAGRPGSRTRCRRTSPGPPRSTCASSRHWCTSRRPAPATTSDSRRSSPCSTRTGPSRGSATVPSRRA